MLKIKIKPDIVVIQERDLSFKVNSPDIKNLLVHSVNKYGRLLGQNPKSEDLVFSIGHIFDKYSILEGGEFITYNNLLDGVIP